MISFGVTVMDSFVSLVGAKGSITAPFWWWMCNLIPRTTRSRCARRTRRRGRQRHGRLGRGHGLSPMPLTYDGPWLVGGDRMLDQTDSGWSAAPSEQPCRADLSSLLGGED